VQLRSNIQAGEAIPESKHRHVDTAGFWKDQYSRLHLEKTAIENKLHCAQQQLDLNRVGTHDSILDSISSRPGKRPAESEDVGAWLDGQTNDAMGPAQDMLLRLSSFGMDKTLLQDQPASHFESPFLFDLCANILPAVLRIARYRSVLEDAAKDSSHPEHIEILSRASIDVLALLETALSKCSIPLWSLRSDDDTQVLSLLQQLMHQIVLGFRSCFNTLQDLCRTILGRKERFEIIYRLVAFFDKSLDHLHTLCNIQTENDVADVRRLRHKRVRTEGEFAVNKHLTEMLVCVAQMEWKVGQIGHSEILEGILFLILDRTGRLLSNAVFGEHIASSNRIGNITKEDKGLFSESAKLETGYLIPILHAALGKSSAKKELVARVIAEKTDNANSSSSDFLVKARKLIQSSLLKSAVGGTELQGLNMPNPPADEDAHYIPQIASSVALHGSEWLIESVWALIGWELAVQ
jgi:hypothetical protein